MKLKQTFTFIDSDDNFKITLRITNWQEWGILFSVREENFIMTMRSRSIHQFTSAFLTFRIVNLKSIWCALLFGCLFAYISKANGLVLLYLLQHQPMSQWEWNVNFFFLAPTTLLDNISAQSALSTFKPFSSSLHHFAIRFFSPHTHNIFFSSASLWSKCLSKSG